jgi:hypothetical protein
MYREPEAEYAYDPSLVVVNVRHHTANALPSPAALNAYRAQQDSGTDGGCPKAVEGAGARIF